MSAKRPNHVYIGREKFVCVMFKVVGRDPDGRMRDLQLLRDDEVTHLEGGEQFITAYILESVRDKGGKRGKA